MKGYLILFVLIVWTIIWKGIALWKAAKRSHKWWFIIILVLNTAGILDILYIYVFSDYRKHKENLKNKFLKNQSLNLKNNESSQTNNNQEKKEN
jgi:heme/copper-type cytochrome/quinol oxidase subunit 4